MLKAIPKNFLSWDYEIFDSGRFIAFLDIAWLREKGELVLHDRHYQVGREGVMHGRFLLRDDRGTIAQATKPSALWRSFTVSFQESEYTLAAASPMTRRFLLKRDDQLVGSIYPQHLFSRKAVVDLPDAFALEVQVFLTWLVIIMWKRQHQNTAASQ